MGRRRRQTAAQLTALGGGQWHLAGDLTLAAVGELAAERPSPGDDAQAVLDLGDVRQPSSAGVALLLEWQAALRAADADLVLRNVPPAMERLAALANVDALLGLGELRQSPQDTATPDDDGDRV